MDNESRRLVRQIIRQVHPDLFASNPYERQCNSDSLQVLNAYIDDLANGAPSPAKLEFYVRDAGALVKREAELPASGSLAPLFYAFGLISAEQLNAADPYASVLDTNFLGWLQETVQEAVQTAEQHELLKWRIRKFRELLQEKFALTSVQVGAEYAVSLSEQERQIEALTTLEYGLNSLYQDGYSFEGLSLQLYHPDMCPVESYSYIDETGNYRMRTSYMKSYIADDGCVHLVADQSTIREQLKSLDLDRARMLAFVSDFWLGRVKELTPAVQNVLGVKAVWCDTKTEQNSQKFVIWAGYLLEKRDEIKALLRNRKFSFSLIVHSESDGPLINFHTSSPILNVRTDCPPQHLIEFLVSETGLAASEAANEVQSSREREEALLEKVRKVFGLKCIIKICMNDKVLEGAQKLLENAEVIKGTVDLRGASIALDDCYEVWDSGFISIPFNFKISELPSKIKMLQSGQRLPETAESSASSSHGSLVAWALPTRATVLSHLHSAAASSPCLLPSSSGRLSAGPAPRPMKPAAARLTLQRAAPASARASLQQQLASFSSAGRNRAHLSLR